MAKNSRLRVQKKRKKNRLLLCVFFLCVCGFLGFQVKENKAISDRFVEVFELPGAGQGGLPDRRGTIYDRNYKELAVSLENVSVYAIVRELEDFNNVAIKLAVALEKDPEEILNHLRSDSNRVWIAKNIDQEEEEAVKALNISGVFLHREVSRYYPEHKTGSHLIGFSAADVGLAGVEYFYDQVRDQMSSDSLHIQEGTDQVSGDMADVRNLVLTVDLKIQRVLEDFVENLGKTRPGVKVGACLLESANGAIVGAANFPSYDPNFFRDYSAEILENHILSPIAIPTNMRTALRDAIIVKQSKELNEGIIPWSVTAPKVSLGAELHMWGPLGLESSPKFDFSIDGHPKNGSLLHVLQNKQGVDVGTAPVFASPLQMLTAFTTLINGGNKITPFSVEKIVDEIGEKKVAIHSDEVSVPIISEKVSAEISNLMSSQAIKGKIGGAYVFGESTQYVEKNGMRDYTANQIVIAPVPFDKPEIILMLVIKDSSFTPYSKDEVKLKNLALTKSMNNLLPSLVALQQVMKNLSDMMQVSKAEEMNLPLSELRKKGGPQLVKIDSVVSSVMPNLIGQSLRKSLRQLNEKQIEIRVSGSGVVVSQKPAPGTLLDQGSICQVTLGPKDHEMLQ